MVGLRNGRILADLHFICKHLRVLMCHRALVNSSGPVCSVQGHTARALRVRCACYFRIILVLKALVALAAETR